VERGTWDVPFGLPVLRSASYGGSPLRSETWDVECGTSYFPRQERSDTSHARSAATLEAAAGSFAATAIAAALIADLIEEGDACHEVVDI
jgi:hypothetical protein